MTRGSMGHTIHWSEALEIAKELYNELYVERDHSAMQKYKLEELIEALDWYKSRYAKPQEDITKIDTNDHAHTGIGIQPTPIMNGKKAYEEMNAEYFYIVDLDQERIYEEVTRQYWDFTHESPQRYMGYKVEEHFHN